MLGLGWCVGFSLIAGSGSSSLVAVCRLLVAVASLGVEQQLRGSRAQAQQLQPTGLVALWYVGSSQIRGQTHVSCVGRWILYH